MHVERVGRVAFDIEMEFLLLPPDGVCGECRRSRGSELIVAMEELIRRISP